MNVLPRDETAVLYASPLSGYAYKAALLLLLLGMPYQLRLVDLSLPREQRPAEFRALARFGEVPVLLIDGQAICQSNVICEYLSRRQSALQEGDESQRLAVREWLYWEAERIGLNLAHFCAARQFSSHPPAVADWYQARAGKDLEHLAGVLARRPFLVGEHATIADIACHAWLPYAQALGLFTQLPAPLQEWTSRITALPGYASPAQVFAETATGAQA
ncbi:MAG: glutathione S-transferase family protein [Gammaproteobacteria bacterium]|nr:glutathione S-transferase family protein [Gammaproteobacteria bacterium]